MLMRPAKMPLETSFAWLCGFIGTLRDAIVLLTEGKHEVNAKVDFTIPTTGWAAEDASTASADHPYYIDVTVPGLLASDIVAVNVSPGSVETARAANFASTESFNGRFRLRVEHVPLAAITAQYHVTNTVAYPLTSEEEEN